MDDEQLLDYEEEQEETVDQNKNEPAANGDAKKIKVSREPWSGGKGFEPHSQNGCKTIFCFRTLWGKRKR